MQAKTPADIGRLIRSARVAAGLTQSELAARCDTSQTWISFVENGKDTAELGMVLKVLSILKISVDLRDASDSIRRTAAGSADDLPDIDGIADGAPGPKP